MSTHKKDRGTAAHRPEKKANRLVTTAAAVGGAGVLLSAPAAGAVAVGLGAAMASGAGIAAADTGTSGGSTSSAGAGVAPSTPAGSAALAPGLPTGQHVTSTPKSDTQTTKVSATTVSRGKTPPTDTASSHPPATSAAPGSSAASRLAHKPVAAVTVAAASNTPAAVQYSLTPATQTPMRAIFARTPTARLSTASAASTLLSGAAAPAASTFAFAAAAPAVQQSPTQLTAPVTVLSIVNDVLSWLGAGPIAANPLLPTVPVPPPLDLIWTALRRIGYTVFNQPPTVHPTLNAEDPRTGVITGQLNANDINGDHLTYTVTQMPANGTVTVDGAGRFTYTPGETESDDGGQDSFTVAVDDGPGNPPHIHGPLGLFGGSHPTTATVHLTVAATATPPSLVGRPVTVDGAPLGGVVLIGDGTRAVQTTDVVDPTTGAETTVAAIINSADGTVIGTPVTLDGTAFFTPLVTPDGSRLYQAATTIDPTTGQPSTQVAVINTADGSLVADPITLNGGPGPRN